MISTASPAPVPVLPRSPARLLRQTALFCPCGEGLPEIRGLCRRCYRARAHSRAHFGGHREGVLERDGGCRGCGARGRLHVHHRRPGVDQARWLVSLCAGCHARVHRLAAIRRWIPDPLVEFWVEQHPGAAVQLQLSAGPEELALAA